MAVRRARVRPADAGLTLLELVFVLALGAILLAMAVPELLAGIDDYRAHAAARYVAAELYRSRSLAVRQSRRVAWRFLPDGDDYCFAAFADGNGNGVRTADINGGVDERLTSDVRLSARFGGVRFAIGDGVPLIDGGISASPIRLSSGTLLTFSPDGSASTGSVYIRGRGATQYAVRVFGPTGRTRVFRYLRGTWKALS